MPQDAAALIAEYAAAAAVYRVAARLLLHPPLTAGAAAQPRAASVLFECRIISGRRVGAAREGARAAGAAFTGVASWSLAIPGEDAAAAGRAARLEVCAGRGWGKRWDGDAQ